MAMQRSQAGRGGISAAALFAAAALVLVPGTGLALGAIESDGARSEVARFTPASVDARLAQFAGNRRSGDLVRFTPAGTASRQGRSVTVAVRVDEDMAQALSVRSALGAAANEQPDSAVARIAPTRFNLGLSRGYQNFAKAPDLARELSDQPIPDLASFRPSTGAKEKPSRFAARIAVEEEQGAGRTARSPEAIGDQTFDLGGSYRVTRNLDVTAGVRYSQDRDRIAPLTNGKQDSQAVYVGTQFRF